MRNKLLAIAAALVSPVTITVAELEDKFDESKTTAFQPDLVISAWGSWIVLCIIIFVGAKAVADAKEAKNLAETMSKP